VKQFNFSETIVTQNVKLIEINKNRSKEKPFKINVLKGFEKSRKAFGGELGIRTPGPVTDNSFQDCRNRPLCQLSGAKVRF
jgi:hypothetical protein